MDESDWGFSAPASPGAAGAPPPSSAPQLPAAMFVPPPVAAPPMPGPGFEIPGAPGAPLTALGGMGMEAPAFGSGEPPAGHMLGFSMFALAIGTGAGLYYGGPFGGVAGALLAGAGVNAYRAAHQAASPTPDTREALISLTWALLSAGAGGYVAWRLYERQGKKEH